MNERDSCTVDNHVTNDEVEEWTQSDIVLKPPGAYIITEIIKRDNSPIFAFETMIKIKTCDIDTLLKNPYAIFTRVEFALLEAQSLRNGVFAIIRSPSSAVEKRYILVRKEKTTKPTIDYLYEWFKIRGFDISSPDVIECIANLDSLLRKLSPGIRIIFIMFTFSRFNLLSKVIYVHCHAYSS